MIIVAQGAASDCERNGRVFDYLSGEQLLLLYAGIQAPGKENKACTQNFLRQRVELRKSTPCFSIVSPEWRLNIQPLRLYAALLRHGGLHVFLSVIKITIKSITAIYSYLFYEFKVGGWRIQLFSPVSVKINWFYSKYTIILLIYWFLK